ncbi:hypothetical protein GUJ93_ZPchr0003g17347 [Zizania palustris]|uniref:Uncharacterized protein n=1 Tax=Zizania palustris TaxID=103762 RepID=A0A8J5SG33_ZIZPA|nr:hypothetical protein GUJ93_ZPchr0003g17347 [Zizania palustris]
MFSLGSLEGHTPYGGREGTTPSSIHHTNAIFHNIRQTIQEGRDRLFSIRIFLAPAISSTSSMGSKNDAPTWSDQWASGDDGSFKNGGGGGGAGDDAKKEKKTVAGNVKAAASGSFVKAKAAALVGAHKVRSGTSSGIKWVKDQYQKRASK